MIHVDFIGRLGNNLIQYTLGRFLAEKKGYQLSFSTVGETSIDTMFKLFPNTNEKLSGIINNENILHVGYDSVSNHVQHYDLNTLLSHEGHIRIKGFFQKHNLFFQEKDMIKSYFSYDDSDLKTSKDYDVVIHIRLGDYVQLNHFIDPNKLYHLYKDLSFSNALVLTDDPNHQYLDLFYKDNKCTIERNSVIQDLHYMATSKNIIISQSTFSWWGSYLGEDKTIYVPYTNSNYPWPYEPKHDDIDLIPNIKNYVKVKV